MTPEKTFVAAVTDGPPALDFVEFTLACQREEGMGEYDKMYFTLKTGDENPPRVEVEVRGFFNNGMKYADYKIFCVIRKIIVGSLPPIIEGMIQKENLRLHEIGLEGSVVIIYDPCHRKGKLYGPLNNLPTNALLCKRIISAAVSTDLITPGSDVEIFS